MSPPPGLPIGELNDVELVLGLRGYGKSTYCAHRAMVLQSATGGYVVGHSLGARFPAKLPDGTNVPVDFYPTIEKLDKGLQSRPDRIAILVGGNGDEIIKYARRLSARIRRAAYYRDNGWYNVLYRPWSNLRNMDGIVARPVIVIVDEGVAMSMNLGKTSTKNPESKEFREAIYGARHEHIAYLFQIQDPNAIGSALQTQATHYIVFRLEHEWPLNGVRAAGATRYDIEEIKTLDIGEYVDFGPAVSKERAADDARIPKDKEVEKAEKTIETSTKSSTSEKSS